MKRTVLILIILAVGTTSLGLGYWIGFVSSSIDEKFEVINSRLEELKNEPIKIPLIYGEKGFELMRHDFNAHPLYGAALNRQIELGDTNAMKFKKLFNNPYRSISTLGMSEKEIDDMILVFYISKNTTEEFKMRPLPETAPVEIKKRVDSINSILEEIKNRQIKDMQTDK